MREAREHRRGVWAVALAIAWLASACGPIEYVNQVTRKASASVAAAKAANAEQYSPYYYTRAIEYLHKAREEAANADYQAANRFGRLSHEAAKLAKEEAIRNASDPSYQTPSEISGIPSAQPGDGEDGDGKDGDGASEGKSDGLAPLSPATPNGDESGDGDGADGDSADGDSADGDSDGGGEL